MRRIENLIGRHLETGNQIHVAEIASGEAQIGIVLVIDDENLPAKAEPRQCLRKRFRLVPLERKRITTFN
jgi:hypothetical protein